jgi:hypothetical protein
MVEPDQMESQGESYACLEEANMPESDLSPVGSPALRSLT